MSEKMSSWSYWKEDTEENEEQRKESGLVQKLRYDNERRKEQIAEVKSRIGSLERRLSHYEMGEVYLKKNRIDYLTFVLDVIFGCKTRRNYTYAAGEWKKLLVFGRGKALEKARQAKGEISLLRRELNQRKRERREWYHLFQRELERTEDHSYPHDYSYCQNCSVAEINPDFRGKYKNGWEKDKF